MMFPLVADLAADRIPVAVTCRVLGFSKQAFYQWRANPVSQRDWDDAHLINAAIDIHHDDPEFGYRFITDELAGVGITASRSCSRVAQRRRFRTFFCSGLKNDSIAALSAQAPTRPIEPCRPVPRRART